jgi:hypothetical protein
MLSAPDLHAVRGTTPRIYPGELCPTLWHASKLPTKVYSAIWQGDKILRAIMNFRGVLILWVVMGGLTAIFFLAA